MKKTALFLVAFLTVSFTLNAQQMKNIKLNKPDMSRKTTTVMQALEQRKSTRGFANKELSMQDLSDLCWAACGVNRADGRRTSPTAMNMQEIDLYVFTKDGVYLYDAKNHELTQVLTTDTRKYIATQDYVNEAPACLLIVSDLSRFGGSKSEQSLTMTSCDAGIVSQNISIFCSGAGLATVPRGMMDQDNLRKALNFNDNHIIILNHPVGYMK